MGILTTLSIQENGKKKKKKYNIYLAIDRYQIDKWLANL